MGSEGKAGAELGTELKEYQPENEGQRRSNGPC